MLDLERQLREYGRDLDQRARATSRLGVPDVPRPGPPRMKTRRAWMVAAALLGITALVAGIVVAFDGGGQSRFVSTAVEPDRAGDGLLFASPLVFEEQPGGALRKLEPKWPEYYELRSIERAGTNRFVALVNEKPWATEATYSLIVVDKGGSVVTHYEDVGGLDVKLLAARGPSALLQRSAGSDDPLALFDLGTGTERVLETQANAFAGDLGSQSAITVGAADRSGRRGCRLTRVDFDGTTHAIELPSLDCGSGAVVVSSPDKEHAAVGYFSEFGRGGLSLRLAVVDLSDGTVELDKRLGTATTRVRSLGLGAVGWSRDSDVVRVGTVERSLDRRGNAKGGPGEIDIREVRFH